MQNKDSQCILVPSIPEISGKLHLEMSASLQMCKFYLGYMSITTDAGSLSIVIVYYNYLKCQNTKNSMKIFFWSVKLLNIFLMKVPFLSTVSLNF